jgi:hypothetical protein
MYLVPFALAVSMFTACGDSSSDPKPSKAEECSKGVTAECLVGSWSFVGIANASNNNEIIPNFDYTTGPGKLIFSDDGKFEFDLPTAGITKLDPLDYPVYGDWKIEGKVIKLHSMSTALHKTRTELTPSFTTDGSVIKMTFGPSSLWLMENETDEVSIKANATEVYTISVQ